MKKINTMILGGTKDATEIIKHLKKNYNTTILTTTTTEYGSKLASEAGSNTVIAKALPKEEIKQIIKEQNIDLLIDATHPFAQHITQTSTSISKECKIKYIRFERPPSNLKNINTKNIIYAESFKEAGKIIKNQFKQGNILHFAGANTMEEILENISSERFYPRILKVPKSIKKCEKLKIPKTHIIKMKGTSTLQENKELIEKYNAKVIITKESGEIGGVIEKIQAANEKNITTIMIKRPVIKELEKENIVQNIKELDEKLKKINAETGN